MAGEPVIRRATPDDAGVVSQLATRTFTETFGHLYPAEDLQARGWPLVPGRSGALLSAGVATLPTGVPVGMIAGSRPLGLGQFFGRFEGPSDGTVAVAETRLPGLAAHTVIPASHSGLIVSRVAAELAANFLATGAFPDGRAASPPV